jgi:TolB-like protein
MFSATRKWFQWSCILLLAALTGCTSLDISRSPSINVNPYQRIAVLPFTNMTETPQADERASSITANLLRTRGIQSVVNYPVQTLKPELIPGVKRPIPRDKLLHWARKQGAQYAIYGTVTEWNYKVGLDGEPAIGITLDMIDAYTGRVVWSSVGSKSGGSRTALSSVAQELIGQMLGNLHVYTGQNR